jgi:hypothetical protein
VCGARIPVAEAVHHPHFAIAGDGGVEVIELETVK